MTNTYPGHLAVIMACHNRRDKTVASILAAARALQNMFLAIRFYVTDDGSTDGTAEALLQLSLDVRVSTGDGELFWNRGMHVSMRAAMADGADWFLWLNDDTLLDADSGSRLISSALTVPGNIVVGATRNSLGNRTYGGVYQGSWWRRLSFTSCSQFVESVTEVDTMNGNCVLLPHSVVAVLGNLDYSFRHGMGDFDYGLRARAVGLKVYVAPGSVGVCEENPLANPASGADGLGVIARLKRIAGVKYLPPRSWFVFVRRHGGLCWPLFFVWPYCRAIVWR